jgi:hypothetical protein
MFHSGDIPEPTNAMIRESIQGEIQELKGLIDRNLGQNVYWRLKIELLELGAAKLDAKLAGAKSRRRPKA